MLTDFRLIFKYDLNPAGGFDMNPFSAALQEIHSATYLSAPSGRFVTIFPTLDSFLFSIPYASSFLPLFSNILKPFRIVATQPRNGLLLAINSVH